MSLPPTHTSPEQHPLQFCGPHLGAAHFFAVASHTVPLCEQSMHFWPPLPHATDELPLTQTGCPLIWVQQPVGQLNGSQPGTSFAHCRSEGSQ